MDNNFDRLKQLLDKLTTISFLQRLFNWNGIKKQLTNSASDLQKLCTNLEHAKETISKTEVQHSLITRDLNVANEAIGKKNGEIDSLNQKLNDLQHSLSKQTGDYLVESQKNKTLEEQNHELEKKNGILQSQFHCLNEEKQKLAEDVAEYKGTIQNLSERKVQLELEIRDKENDLSNLQRQLRDVQEKNESLTGENCSNLATLKEHEKAVNSLKEQHSFLSEKNGYFFNENKRLCETIATNNQSVIGLTAQNSKLEIDITNLQRDVLEKEATLSEARIKIEQLTGDYSSANSSLKSNELTITVYESDIRLLKEKNSSLEGDNKRLNHEVTKSRQEGESLTTRKEELEIELAKKEQIFNCLEKESAELKKQNTQLQKDEEFRKNEHSNQILCLTRIQDQIRGERDREVEDNNKREQNRLKGQKETWNRHEEKVKSVLRLLCEKHVVNYVDKAPFKGDPDNTLLICDEFIVFDAKSPAGDDLANFPTYLKEQADKAKKYAKQERVKSDIFFVVPANSLESITTGIFRHGDHNVYVVPIESLEPIILCLKKIEEYEFAEQLSPDERENICRIIGHFAHLSKRRIQIDSFFAQQFMQLVHKCEANLPSDILKAVSEFEKAEKINPPMEKRCKSISTKQIEREIKNMSNEAVGRGILNQDQYLTDILNQVPLYVEAEE